MSNHVQNNPYFLKIVPAHVLFSFSVGPGGVGLGSANARTQATPDQTGGPDNSGYTFVDSYETISWLPQD